MTKSHDMTELGGDNLRNEAPICGNLSVNYSKTHQPTHQLIKPSTEVHMSTVETQQPEQTISQAIKEGTVHLAKARNEITQVIAGILNEQEANKAEAFRLLPASIEKWAEVIRANKHILDELHDLAQIAHVSIPFGYGLLPDLTNPVIGTTEVQL
jgi:hypothetical protein